MLLSPFLDHRNIFAFYIQVQSQCHFHFFLLIIDNISCFSVPTLRSNQAPYCPCALHTPFHFTFLDQYNISTFYFHFRSQCHFLLWIMIYRFAVPTLRSTQAPLLPFLPPFTFLSLPFTFTFGPNVTLTCSFLIEPSIVLQCLSWDQLKPRALVPSLALSLSMSLSLLLVFLLSF